MPRPKGGGVELLAHVGEGHGRVDRARGFLDEVQVLHEQLELHLSGERVVHDHGARTSRKRDPAAPAAGTAGTRGRPRPARRAHGTAPAAAREWTPTSRFATSLTKVAWPAGPT